MAKKSKFKFVLSKNLYFNLFLTQKKNTYSFWAQYLATTSCLVLGDLDQIALIFKWGLLLNFLKSLF
jgi:hypothetical protein